MPCLCASGKAIGLDPALHLEPRYPREFPDVRRHDGEPTSEADARDLEVARAYRLRAHRMPNLRMPICGICVERQNLHLRVKKTTDDTKRVRSISTQRTIPEFRDGHRRHREVRRRLALCTSANRGVRPEQPHAGVGIEEVHLSPWLRRASFACGYKDSHCYPCCPVSPDCATERTIDLPIRSLNEKTIVNAEGGSAPKPPSRLIRPDLP